MKQTPIILNSLLFCCQVLISNDSMILESKSKFMLCFAVIAHDNTAVETFPFRIFLDSTCRTSLTFLVYYFLLVQFFKNCYVCILFAFGKSELTLLLKEIIIIMQRNSFLFWIEIKFIQVRDYHAFLAFDRLAHGHTIHSSHQLKL